MFIVLTEIKSDTSRMEVKITDHRTVSPLITLFLMIWYLFLRTEDFYCIRCRVAM